MRSLLTVFFIILILVVGIFSFIGCGNVEHASDDNYTSLSRGSQDKVIPSDNLPGDNYGYVVEIDGDIAVAGAYLANAGGMDRGAAYVHYRNQGGGCNWGEVAILNASDARDYDQYGAVVDIDDDMIIIGAPMANLGGPDRGAAYIYYRDQGGTDNWGEVAILNAPDAEDEDWFGMSVAINNDVVAVGALYEDDADTDAGAVYIYNRNEGGTDNWGFVNKITASDAEASDKFGIAVSIENDILVAGALYEDGDSPSPSANRGAAYVFYRNEGGTDNWGEVAKLTASDAANGDLFGGSFGISNDTIIVGARDKDAPGNPNSGAAYVYYRDQGGADNWGQVKKVTASDPQNYGNFGGSVGIDGDYALIGAQQADSGRGAAYVLSRDQGGTDNWGQIKKISASDAQANDLFGHSLDYQMGTAVVGAFREDGDSSDPNANSGAVYFYTSEELGVPGPTPSEDPAKVVSSDHMPGDNYGYVVEIDGDIAVAGAYLANAGGMDRGAAYVLCTKESASCGWGEVAILNASDARDYDQFGAVVDIDGDMIVIGAPLADLGGTDRGAAYIYNSDEGGTDNWSEVAILSASDAENGDWFGMSVAINNDVVAVGAINEDEVGADGGAVYIFYRDQGGTDNWGQVAVINALDAQAGDNFGIAVSIENDILVVGAHKEDGVGGSDRGAAYVFYRDQGGTDNWGQVAKLTASDAENVDVFGGSFAISNDTIIVGAFWEDAPGKSNAGAAYVFYRDEGGADNWGEVKKLRASDPQYNGNFGGSVGLDGDYAMIGAQVADSGRGAIYLFYRDQGGTDNWGEVDKISAPDAEANDLFGHSLDYQNGTAVIGAFREDGDSSDPNANSGAVYFYQH